jgi:hypothetical protein
MRDLKWPLRHPILTQYTFDRNIKHARYGDPTPPNPTLWGNYTTQIDDETWGSKTLNAYSRLEFNALVPGTPSGESVNLNDSWEGRDSFGLFINEARAIGVSEERGRLKILQDWVLPLDPAFIHGKWSDQAEQKLGFHIQPLGWADGYVTKLQSVRSTFTTPSSGSGWATTKPWEAFAAGVVCFFHPYYDDQDHILRDAPMGLKDWLRVKTPKELAMRVAHLNQRDGRADWEWIVKMQRRHFDDAVAERKYMKMIDDRLRSIK